MEYPSGWNGSGQDLRTRFARLAEAKDFLSRLVSDSAKELAAISEEKDFSMISQDSLSRLEASLSKEKDAGNEELLKKISQLESELERAKSEVVSERGKARKFEAENAKNQYRITHLVRALNASI